MYLFFMIFINKTLSLLAIIDENIEPGDGYYKTIMKNDNIFIKI